MMQLLYPIGLLALAGLIIPVIIHLWNVKKGKTLKIGSIALLGENAKASSRSLYIKDWTLFILRCLLLIALAFLLAQPFLKKINTQAKPGWVLVKKSALKQVYASQKQLIDSLLQSGFELHDFAPEFKPISLSDTSSIQAANDLTYTSLLKQLQTQLPSGFNLYLFADKRFSNFGGDLPRLSLNLKWVDPALADTVSQWESNLRGKVYAGNSSPSLTSYSALNRPDNTPKPLSAAIYADHAADADYIKAVLKAIAQYTQTKIDIANWNGQEPSQADLVFWLSEEAVKLSALRADASLFSYEKGKPLQVNTSLNLQDADRLNQSEIALYKRVADTAVKGKAIWTDGFGDPVLSLEENKDLKHYHFFSRFNPQWTNLVWNSQFVKAILPLVIGTSGFETHSGDQRTLDQQQAERVTLNVSTKTAEQQETKPLSTVFWLIVLFILIAERFLSFRKNKLHELKN